MAATFFFYDLETSGVNPKESRIMQFAGQRTDMQLKHVGEPYDYLIRLSDDVLPQPEAVLITGLTPQKTLADGLTEAEFLKIFHEEIATPDTIFVGFNTVRFDDEFMRYMMYRNFYDPYEWQWRNGRGKWDLIDVVRMTRALRPDGIEWPVDSTGKPTNRLELLASMNNLVHDNAHEALSDVYATIALAELLRDKQPKLFDYLLRWREKHNVADFVMQREPFLYSSGQYASEFEKTTVVGELAEHPQGNGILVFDLRYDPEPFLKLDPPALAEAWRKKKDLPGPRLPVKTLKFNKVPAIAPLTVLDEASQKRLKLDPKIFMKNHKKLLKIQAELSQNVLKALQLLDQKMQARLLEDEAEVDARLYEGFFSNEDRTKMSIVRAADVQELGTLNVNFEDGRLTALLPLYKARNYPKSLTSEEQEIWERFKERKLIGGGDKSQAAKYFKRLHDISERDDITNAQRYLLDELKLYAESILPTES